MLRIALITQLKRTNFGKRIGKTPKMEDKIIPSQMEYMLPRTAGNYAEAGCMTSLSEGNSPMSECTGRMLVQEGSIVHVGQHLLRERITKSC
jgi:hypothetical protein